MAKSGKVAVVLLILLSFICLSLAALIYWKLEKVNKENASFSQRINRFEAKEAALRKENEEYKLQVARLKKDLALREEKIKQLSLSARQELNKKEEVSGQIEALKNDLDSSRREKTSLGKKIALERRKIKEMKEEIARLRQDNQGLKDKIKQLSSAPDVQLGKIVVSGGEGKKEEGGDNLVGDSRDLPEGVPVAPLPPPLPPVISAREPEPELSAIGAAEEKGLVQGKVILVNKEYAFVVIDRGRSHGLSSGDRFSVYHADKYIGDVILDRVDDKMSSANFADSSIKRIIVEGDRVIRNRE